ncbi:MAG: hypothetical protein JWM51_322 [Microbacteriaceae bacterium]|nr:hypothetical protein [Microbacteriaceae bacterium]
MHPHYLDRQALVACWREGLLAQAVIGKTSGGYHRHPQLERFRECARPLDALGVFLTGVVEEADARGYSFAREKILGSGPVDPIALTDGQLRHEWDHLVAKVAARSPEWLVRLDAVVPVAHPMFTVVAGPIASWERLTDAR